MAHSALRIVPQHSYCHSSSTRRTQLNAVVSMSARHTKENGPCQRLACEIQECLQRNGYQQQRCAAAIKRFNECKQRWEESKHRKKMLAGEARDNTDK